MRKHADRLYIDLRNDIHVVQLQYKTAELFQSFVWL